MSFESTGGAATSGESFRYCEIVLELGFVTPEQLEEVIAKQQELEGSGSWTHTGDVLIDLGYLTRDQNEQVKLQQSMRFVLAALPKKRPSAAPMWVVAGLVPVAVLAAPLAIAACAAALVAGAFIARGSRARWVAIGWIAASAVPGVSVAAVAAAGVAVDRVRAHLRLAALVAVTAAVPLLPFAVTPGVLFLVAAGALAVWRAAK